MYSCDATFLHHDRRCHAQPSSSPPGTSVNIMKISQTGCWAALASSALAQRACNNAARLCDLGYDEVLHLGAHDSPFIRDASTGYSTFGNQYFNTTTQLDAGVRLLSAQVYVAANEQTKARELHLCHTSCAFFDAGTLSDWLAEIRTWMDENLNDIVTVLLVNLGGVDARELESEYAKANIARYGYVPLDIHKSPLPSNEAFKTWPTLGNMADQGKRLVSLIQPLTPDKDNAPYLLNEFDFVWENAYGVTNPAQFACTPNRPVNITISDTPSNFTMSEMHDSGRLRPTLPHEPLPRYAAGLWLPDPRRDIRQQYKLARRDGWTGRSHYKLLGSGYAAADVRACGLLQCGTGDRGGE
jgi:hypothetical protein